MAKIKVSEASGKVLDWLVAKCEGYRATIERDEIVYTHPSGEWHHNGNWSPSTKWVQGGPIIDREGISWHCGNKTSWHAYAYGDNDNITGPTSLIAAMRCYVTSKLGDEVEVSKLAKRLVLLS